VKFKMGSERLVRCSVRPYYAQIEFSDPSAPDYPQWGTGEEPAVATGTSVAVATRPDVDGDVEIEVWTGPAQPLSALLWEGEIDLAGDDAVVGNTVGNDLHLVQVGRGHHHLQAWGDVSPLPSRVAFVVNRNQ
jgi:hypothetical protein